MSLLGTQAAISSRRYERHRLETTLLYQLVAQYYPQFQVLPKIPLRQWVLSVPFQRRFLFASYPELMGRALGIVY